MNKSFDETLGDIKKLKYDYLITRHVSDTPNDIDLLVKGEDYLKVIKKLEEAGYFSSSHDHALGGRLPDYQRNLEKKNRIKIDLHKDFTWRKLKYFDVGTLFRYKHCDKKLKDYSPEPVWDASIVLVNIIFEKTYIKDEHDYLSKWVREIYENEEITDQFIKFGYEKTMNKFKEWFDTKELSNDIAFLPLSLIIYSYLEQLINHRYFHIKSFMYYFFFRTRYFINKKLPYD